MVLVWFQRICLFARRKFWRCHGREISFFAASGTRCVIFFTNPL